MHIVFPASTYYFSKEIVMESAWWACWKEVSKRGYLLPLDEKSIPPALKEEFQEGYYDAQAEILGYLTTHSERLVLVWFVAAYISNDMYYADMRQMGGCSEVREWERIRSKDSLTAICHMAAILECKDDLPTIFRMAILNDPVTFFVTQQGSYPQEKLTESYRQVQEGGVAYFQGYLDAIARQQ